MILKVVGKYLEWLPTHKVKKIGRFRSSGRGSSAETRIENSAQITTLFRLEPVLTIRLDSELEVVLAVPSERSTVNAAAKCLNASVSVPPPATSNN